MLEWFATLTFQSQWSPSIKNQVEQDVTSFHPEVSCTMELMIAKRWYVLWFHHFPCSYWFTYLSTVASWMGL